MALALVNDGTNTAGLTGSLNGGFVSFENKLIASNSYASPTAVSVGAAIAGSAGVGVAATFSGGGTSSDHRLYWGLQTQNDLTANHYYAKIYKTASHLRDYVEIYKVVSTVHTLLTPAASETSLGFVSSTKIYLKRGKITNTTVFMARWLDNEHQLFVDGFFMGKVMDTSITGAGYCGLYLGTDNTGSWDDVWTGAIPINWVATTGDNLNAGTKASPWLTIRHGADTMTAGGVLMVRTGNYAGRINSSFDGFAWTKGTSWYNPSIIQEYNSEAPVVTYTGGTGSVSFSGTQGTYQNAYIQWIGININGGGVHAEAGIFISSRATKIRIQGCEVMNHIGSGAVQTSYTNDAASGRPTDYETYFIDMKVHDNGDTYNVDHNFYTSRGIEIIEYCDIYNAYAFGIHCQAYPTVNGGAPVMTVTRFCKLHGNGQVGGSAGGWTAAYGSGCHVYGCEIYQNHGAGLQVSGNATYGQATSDTKIYNNTIYDNGGYGLMIGVGSGGSGTTIYNRDNEIINNIFYQNDLGDFQIGARDGDAGHQTVWSNNWLNSMGSPGLTNAAGLNFTIASSGSGVVNAGADTSSLMTVDILGYQWPQGDHAEIGAYSWPEAANPTVPPLLVTPNSFSLTVNVETALGTQFDVLHDVEAAPYSARIVVSGGTIREAP